MKRLLALLLVLAAAGCQSAAPRDYTPTLARFFLESSDPRALSVELPKSGVRLSIAPTPALTEGDIVNVEVMQVDLGRCLMFQLTPSAARDLYRFTAANQGARLVLMINGAAFGARRIDGPVEGGTLFIFAEVDDASLSGLVTNLKRTSADVQQAAAKKR
jgi:hypothetical protein